MTWILALDFGGTKHSAGVVARGDDRWLAQSMVLSPAGADATEDMRIMQEQALRLLEGRRPSAVGVSFGGPVDSVTGTVRLSHHVPGWEEVPLASHLAELFAAPVVVDNDANAAAMGEYRYGAGRGRQHLLYVTISTGVGGGWILDGKPWRGAGGMAGEIGHTVIDPNGPTCLCGKRGCVERLASGPYMALDAEALLAVEPESGALLRSLAGEGRVTGRMLSTAAAQGDEIARSILLRGARALGVGLGNAANLVDPGLIVLGGGVTKSGPDWWRTVRNAVQETVLPEVDVNIEPAALGDEAPLWGAVALAHDQLQMLTEH